MPLAAAFVRRTVVALTPVRAPAVAIFAGRAARSSTSPTRALAAFSWRTYSSLGARKYSRDHEWVTVENGIGTVGITDHAQKKLGDAIFVEVPSAEIRSSVEKKGQIGAVESVKAVSDVYAPVSGWITEANEELTNQPSLINTSPYELGWICKIKLSDEKELEELMDEEAYKKFTAEDI